MSTIIVRVVDSTVDRTDSRVLDQLCPELVYKTIPNSANNYRFSTFGTIFLETIESNQVVIISGDTGCGKTTQLPQYLLEYCAQNQKPCHIVCAEPRRLAAISVAERICVERTESIGRTVGYQIRLESRVINRKLVFLLN